MDTLERAWLQCLGDLRCLRPAPSVLEDLRARYGEPHRAYHTLQHLDECFGWFERTRSLASRPGEVALALFYHDAIYDTHARDSEERSAKLAVEVLKGIGGSGDPDRVTTLIMATKHDAVPDSIDAQLLVDIDLSILGASPDRFDEYERQVRTEYDWVAPDAFREGRSRIMKQFLDRSAIYCLPFFRERLESSARENLKESLRKFA